MITVAMPGRCPFCSGVTKVEVSSPEEASAVLAWLADDPRTRPFVQDAFPHFTLDDREAMISASHGECFDAAVSPWGTRGRESFPPEEG